MASKAACATLLPCVCRVAEHYVSWWPCVCHIALEVFLFQYSGTNPGPDTDQNTSDAISKMMSHVFVISRLFPRLAAQRMLWQCPAAATCLQCFACALARTPALRPRHTGDALGTSANQPSRNSPCDCARSPGATHAAYPSPTHNHTTTLKLYN